MMPSPIVFRWLAALSGVCLLYVAYVPGLTGALFYDDYGNLEGLAKVVSFDTARQFVFSGFAGPLGRPISLASFVPHAAGWPANSSTILAVNVAIHVINAVLLGVLGYLLLGFRAAGAMTGARRFWVAAGAAMLWGSLPILASTSLIAIQRMTSLAAFFTLLGLICFVTGYAWRRQRPFFGFVLQFGMLGLFTVLSMFSKESGVLTPVFALIIHMLFADRRIGNLWTRYLSNALLWGALLAILVYLSPVGRDWFSISSVRGYSGWDRLQTQMVILWQYMDATFFPRPSRFGPFHDHLGADYRGGVSLLAALGWLALLACGLWVRRTFDSPWVLLGVVWFLAGHLLESTTVMLEIYFEHRNYLATYGWCLALAALVGHAPALLKRVAPVLFALYLSIQFAVLVALTSFWGDPDRSAELWSYENPASGRAAIHLVLRDLGNSQQDIADLNFRFIERQRREYALSIFDRTITRCPSCLGIRMEALVYSCVVESEEAVRARLRDVINLAGHGAEARSTVIAIFRLRDLINDGLCPSLAHQDLLTLIEQLRHNTLYRIEHIQARALFVAAALAEDMGNIAGRDDYLAQAERVFPAAVPVLEYQVISAVRESRYDDALAAIERRRRFVGFTSGALTGELVDDLEQMVEASRRESVE